MNETDSEIKDGVQPETEITEEIPSKEKRGFIKRIKAFGAKVKKNVLTLYLSFFKVKWYKKALIILVLLYALSPIDLIPDFIPVLGYLDDLIIIPIGVWLCRKLIPADIWEECRSEVEQGVKIKRRYKVIGCILIVLIWAAIITGILLKVL